MKEFIRECESIEEANAIDLEVFRFEGYSNTRDRFIFVRRRGK